MDRKITTFDLATTLTKDYCYADKKYINIYIIIDDIRDILDDMIKSTQFDITSANYEYKNYKTKKYERKIHSKIRDKCYYPYVCNIFTILTCNIQEIMLKMVSPQLEYPRFMEVCRFKILGDVVDYYYKHVLNRKYSLDEY